MAKFDIIPIRLMMANVISMSKIKVIMTLTRLMMMTLAAEVRANYRCWCPAGITSKK